MKLLLQFEVPFSALISVHYIVIVEWNHYSTWAKNVSHGLMALSQFKFFPNGPYLSKSLTRAGKIDCEILICLCCLRCLRCLTRQNSLGAEQLVASTPTPNPKNKPLCRIDSRQSQWPRPRSLSFRWRFHGNHQAERGTFSLFRFFVALFYQKNTKKKPNQNKPYENLFFWTFWLLKLFSAIYPPYSYSHSRLWPNLFSRQLTFIWLTLGSQVCEKK